MNQDKPSRTRLFRKPKFYIIIFAVLIFFAAYSLVISRYLVEGEKNTSIKKFFNPGQENGLLLDARVVSFDPVKGDLALRLEITPQGKLTKDNGLTSTSKIKIISNIATGQMERIVEKDTLISPIDMTINLEGFSNNYPFDQYDGTLFVITLVKEEDNSELLIPIDISFTDNLPGYQIKSALDQTEIEPEKKDSVKPIQLHIQRSSVVVGVVIAGMAIMWAVCIAVTILTIAFILNKRKAEPLAFYSSLLFGLFGLRNSLPGIPAIGSLCDFISFIWVEAIIAVMLILTIAFLMVRPQK